jgi:hypothetical protein
VHVATASAGALHDVVQLPQWFGSLVVSTHVLPHRVGALEGHPLLHAYPPAPLGEQTGVPPVHATLHAPHEDGWEKSVSQPSSGLLVQWP